MNLTSLTLMIPIKIDSRDRLFNISTVLGYLNHHLKTNVKIFEVYSETAGLDSNLLNSFKNLNIDYKSKKIGKIEPFHKTKYLNEMLYTTNTEFVAVYDADILLPISSFEQIIAALSEDSFDFIYPFRFGIGQKRLFYNRWNSDSKKDGIYPELCRFLETFDLKHLDEHSKVMKLHNSEYGHAIFCKTSSYKDAFGENEDFISYGPEDSERGYRFQKLGYRVSWYDSYVYHFEHERTMDSDHTNPFFVSNEKLFEKIKKMNKRELENYYLEKKIYSNNAKS